jgi:hypothetical protein
MPTRRSTIPSIEILTPSRPNPRDPIVARLLALLDECVAWMDAPHRQTPLSRAIVADAKRVLDAANGGAR